MEERLKRDAVEIFLAGVKAVDPGRAVRDHVSLNGETLFAGDLEIPLSPVGKIFIIGAGKAGAPMAAALEQVLGDRIYEGLVVVKYDYLAPVRKVRIREAAHPVPDKAGLAAAQEVTKILAKSGEHDLVICLLSGGGSALLPCPAPPVSLAEKQAVTNLLLASGANINEINCIRKHLSLLKGGGIVRMAYPARLITLILSDVVGDSLDVIASGPTVGDPTTFNDALDILDRYELTGKVPKAVLTYLTDGVRGSHPETLKPDAPELAGVSNILVGTNAIALRSAEGKARDLGYKTKILSTSITGDTRQAAVAHATLAKEILSSGQPLEPPACVLSGGETTVIIHGTGKGGRNTEFALAAAMGIDGLSRVVILSGSTDGTDGPTDTAGALATGSTATRARSADMDPVVYLENNDSYHFFEKLGDLLKTGPTLTNVMDLRVVLVDRQ